MGKTPNISIIYRALNEERWFDLSLNMMQKQVLDGLTMEIVLVDSGSTDGTLHIAHKHDCRVTHIKKSDFSFGRSLNQGCDFSSGKYLVFISAHCIPSDEHWLQNLVNPLLNKQASYVYGRQVGNEVSQFSEKQIFNKYFPEESQIPQEGFFVNNANSAILREIWQTHRFDEKVTGLEDMVLGKTLVEQGKSIAYVADASVIHVHEESFKQTQWRYYREALTLRDILPDIHMGIWDFFRYLFASIGHDLKMAGRQKQRSKFLSIVKFRFAQFWGSYKGHNEINKLSRTQKERYYYPAPSKKNEESEYSPPKITKRMSAK